MSSDCSVFDLGWDAGWDAACPDQDPMVRPARVARVDRAGLDLLGAGGPPGSPLRVRHHPGTAGATVGDWVLLDDRDLPSALLPRRTEVRRGGPGRDSRDQVLAANVDLVGVVGPLPAVPNLARTERFLALAWESGATPLVLLTKADLATPEELAWSRRRVAAAAPGAGVCVVSAVAPGGLAELAAWLGVGRTLVLLGPSGSGKSTLANALLGADRLAVQAVRTADGKGRHTTTARQLVVLPGGGVLIDTPGLRGVGLAATDGAGLDRAFADIADLAAGCRFADCAHVTEPGCAVRAALEDGTVSARRLDSWQKLQREQDHAAVRRDARLAAERRQRWKAVARAQRAHRPRP